MRLRPHSADSTMLRLGRPVHLSGLLPLIATRWFSSSLSDPASRRTPCPPKIRRWRLQVSLSVSRLSPSCLTSLSIPSHPLRPVRHYPHLWISARGLGLSGTSTHLTRQLSGTHYGPLRHPSAPGLSLAGVRLIIPDHALGFPVLRALSLCTCCRHYPGAADGRTCRSKIAHPCQPSPIPLSGRPAHRPFRGLLGVYSRCGLHTRAVTNFVTAIRGLQTFRHLHACPGCFRLERSPGGACTRWISAALSRRTGEAVVRVPDI